MEWLFSLLSVNRCGHLVLLTDSYIWGCIFNRNRGRIFKSPRIGDDLAILKKCSLKQLAKTILITLNVDSPLLPWTCAGKSVYWPLEEVRLKGQ